MNITSIIVGVVAFLVGALIAVVLGNGKRQKLVQEAAALQGKIDGADKLLESTKQMYEQKLKDIQADAEHDMAEAKKTWESDTRNRIDTMQRLLDQTEAHHKQEKEEQEKRFNQMMSSMEDRMKAATDSLLKDRQAEFASSSNKEMESIIKPLAEKIKDMKEEMQKTQQSNTETKTSIEANMNQIIQHNLAAQKSAEMLTQALHHQPKVQGDWGENILDNLLSTHGLRKDIDYEVQPVLRDEDGNVIKPEDGSNMRPDVILHLDSTRDIIIDSKVVLTDYIDYANATDEASRSEALDRHVKCIEKRVKDLAGKNYQQYLKKGHTLDFVIMFVPLPQMLYAATSRKPSLWSWAMESRVFIADEQTLYAALKIISLTWKQLEQEENQKKLIKNAGLMLDRVALFLTTFNKIGKNIEDISTSFKDAKSKLLDTGQSIPVSAKKMLELGADYKTGSTKIPSEYLNPGESDDEDE